MLSLDDNDHFLPKRFRWYTLAAIVFILMLGAVSAAFGVWNFLLLGVGELVLYAIYTRQWKKAQNRSGLASEQTGSEGSFSFWRYICLAWLYAMIMEFCVDFGSYGTFNPLIVLLVMLALTPHYLFLAAAFRLWFRWFSFSARQAYFTMGVVGFLLESIILKAAVGTFTFCEILHWPIDVPVHILNYGGFVLLPTLLHNRSRQGQQPRRTGGWKYAAAIGGTLALAMPEIAATYWLVYNVILKN